MRAGCNRKGDPLQTSVRANVTEEQWRWPFVWTDIVFHRPVPKLCRDDLEYLSSYPPISYVISSYVIQRRNDISLM
jgi:predicted RNA methylase